MNLFPQILYPSDRTSLSVDPAGKVTASKTPSAAPAQRGPESLAGHHTRLAGQRRQVGEPRAMGGAQTVGRRGYDPGLLPPPPPPWHTEPVHLTTITSAIDRCVDCPVGLFQQHPHLLTHGGDAASSSRAGQGPRRHTLLGLCCPWAPTVHAAPVAKVQPGCGPQGVCCGLLAPPTTRLVATCSQSSL